MFYGEWNDLMDSLTTSFMTCKWEFLWFFDDKRQIALFGQMDVLTVDDKFKGSVLNE